MKIVVFGTGKIYEDFKKYLYQDELVAFLDNDFNKCGKKIRGITIYSPQDIMRIDFNVIVLMSDYAINMREQLLQMGIEEEKIVHYKDYFASFVNEIVWYSQEKKRGKPYQKSLLIITGDLGFHGASIVAMEMAKIAKENGYKVVLAGVSGEKEFIEDVIKSGIEVCIARFLERFEERDLNWAKGYDYIVVNTLPMIACALALAKEKKVLFYLHEEMKVYEGYKYWKKEIEKEISNPNIKILAVSNIAKNNFLKYYPTSSVIEIFEPLCREKVLEERKNIGVGTLKVCMAGNLTEGKAQNILLEAYERLNDNVRMNCEILFIGKELEGEYAQKILTRINNNKGCCFLGKLQHNDLMKVIGEVDVIVVPSWEETMSLVAIEGMMCGKPCVVSENTGVASYIRQGENGFCFPTGDAVALSERLEWCFFHRDKLSIIGAKARSTYEAYFTEQVFGEKFWGHLYKM